MGAAFPQLGCRIPPRDCPSANGGRHCNLSNRSAINTRARLFVNSKHFRRVSNHVATLIGAREGAAVIPLQG